MDLDALQMSPGKRAFTVERSDMNANAPGRHSHSHRYKIASLFRLPRSLLQFCFPSLALPCLLTLNEYHFSPLSVCAARVYFCVRYWFLRVVFCRLLTSPL